MSLPRKTFRNVGNDLAPVSNNIIDKLGVGPEIIRLLKAGLTHAQISQQLNIDVGIVNSWIQRYRQLDEPARQEVAQRSIFAIADRLQENFTELYRVLDDVRQAGDNENTIRAFSEIRQYLKFASDVIEKLETMKQMEKFKEVVLDLLDQEAPGIKVKALRRLQQEREAVSILRPY